VHPVVHRRLSDCVVEGCKCREPGVKLQASCGRFTCATIFVGRFVPSDSQGARVNKQELVATVAKRLGLTKAKANEIAELFFAPSGLIASELKRGGRVALSGFGSFEARKRAAREWRDPRTGKSVSIKASVVPAFRASRALRDQINKKR
jgi:DNA-binding protein HU-beta